MTDNRWKNYFDKTKDAPPRPLLVEALPFVKEKGCAFDLGAGALSDSRYLVEQGLSVVALDKKSVADFFQVPLPEKDFEYVIEPFEEFKFPVEKYDLVNAQFSLPFISPSDFQRVFASIKNSLKTNGIFVGQLFGNQDSWSDDPTMTFHTKTEAENLFEGLKIHKFLETEKDGTTAKGDEKHWHVFHFIVEK